MQTPCYHLISPASHKADLAGCGHPFCGYQTSGAVMGATHRSLCVLFNKMQSVRGSEAIFSHAPRIPSQLPGLSVPLIMTYSSLHSHFTIKIRYPTILSDKDAVVKKNKVIAITL